MYNNNNNIYRGLIKKAMIISIIRPLRPSKHEQTVIAQQPASSPTSTEASVNFPMPEDDDMGQHVSPINKPGPQEIILLHKNRSGSKMIWFKILPPSIYQYHNIFCFLDKNKFKGSNKKS